TAQGFIKNATALANPSISAGDNLISTLSTFRLPLAPATPPSQK
ncbi:MAG: hypothetical protein ACI9LY_002943, partial [Arenicella sp.]